MTQIAIEKISDNPYQPRTTDNAEHIENLARSIAADGLLQKPTARQLPDGSYQLAFGHSRRKAIEWLNANYQAQGLTDRYQGYSVMPLEVVELTDEEMYRSAVSENVQRKDLNPIELAKAMQVYRDQFNKSSKEIGELFGMNDATVRGILRLHDLPKDWQNELAAGTISQGIARIALSLQKVIPAPAMKGMLKEIKSNPANAEDIIGDILGDLRNVENMWNEHNHPGKPRADWRNSWLLDMKNFPNKLLPNLTVNEAVAALDIEGDGRARPMVSAWIGSELGMFDTANFQALSPEHQEKLKHLLNPPACTACPFYAKLDGTHYCGMKVCHIRKTTAWHLSILQAAIRDLNIQAYEESDGMYRVLASEDAALFNKRHKDLRLIQKENINGSHYQYGLKGVDDDVLFVVATGEALDKMKSTTAKGGKKTEKEKDEMRAMKLYRTRRKELMWEFAGVAQGMFENVPASVLQILNTWHYIGIDDRILDDPEPAENAKDDVRRDYQCRALVWRLIAELSNHYTRESLVDLMAEFHELTQVRIPKSLIKRAEEWEAEIVLVAKPVATETAAKKKGR